MGSTSLWACALVVLLAVGSDILTRRIPNTVSLGGLVVGLAIHGATGAVDGGLLGALRGLAFALGGAFACGILPFISWRRNELGGGDVKLFAAIGALLGPVAGFNIQAFTFALCLLVLVPYRMARYGTARVTLGNLRIAVTNLVRRRGARLPYLTRPKCPPVILAPTIGLAFVVTVLQQGML